MHSHPHHLRLGLGLAQRVRLHPRHQEAQNRLPRQPGPTPLRRPRHQRRRLGVCALTLRARFDGIIDGDLDRDRRRGGSVPFPRGCQVLPLAAPSLARRSLILALTFPSRREMVFDW